jgi:hypothetical protein
MTIQEAQGRKWVQEAQGRKWVRKGNFRGDNRRGEKGGTLADVCTLPQVRNPARAVGVSKRGKSRNKS